MSADLISVEQMHDGSADLGVEGELAALAAWAQEQLAQGAPLLDTAAPFKCLPVSLLGIILGTAGLWMGEGYRRMAA